MSINSSTFFGTLPQVRYLFIVLQEINNTRQIPGEKYRRWFSSTKSDLIVWYNQIKEPVGFQLCYDKNQHEKQFTWKLGGASDHTAIDTGENVGINYKQTPIHVADGTPDYTYIKKQFCRPWPEASYGS